jgi:hypothetical protein
MRLTEGYRDVALGATGAHLTGEPKLNVEVTSANR